MMIPLSILVLSRFFAAPSLAKRKPCFGVQNDSSRKKSKTKKCLQAPVPILRPEFDSPQGRLGTRNYQLQNGVIKQIWHTYIQY